MLTADDKLTARRVNERSSSDTKLTGLSDRMDGYDAVVPQDLAGEDRTNGTVSL